MPQALDFVGIDASKDWLDVWIEPTKLHQRFANDPAGHQALFDALAPLGQPGAVILACEASGGYERDLRNAALTAGFEVRLLNPARVRLCAESLGRQARNDRIDARLIARYAHIADTRPEVLDHAREQLAELVSHRRRQPALLKSLKGIGDVTAATLLPRESAGVGIAAPRPLPLSRGRAGVGETRSPNPALP